MEHDQRFGHARSVTLPGPLALDGGAEPRAASTIAYETYGTLNADASQRRADLPRADRRPACRQRPPASPASPAGGRGWSATGKPIDPARHFIVCANVLGSLHGLDRARRASAADGAPYRDALPGDHDPRHGARAGDAARSSRHRRAARGGRRIDGRDAGARMGGDLSRARARGGGDRVAPRGIRRRTSPSTRSAARRSWPIRNGAAATITTAAIRPPRASRWRGWRRTSPICPKRA